MKSVRSQTGIRKHLRFNWKCNKSSHCLR